eukprot:1361871-Rhodomonas_salina.1
MTAGLTQAELTQAVLTERKPLPSSWSSHIARPSQYMASKSECATDKQGGNLNLTEILRKSSSLKRVMRNLRGGRQGKQQKRDSGCVGKRERRRNKLEGGKEEAGEEEERR